MDRSFLPGGFSSFLGANNVAVRRQKRKQFGTAFLDAPGYYAVSETYSTAGACTMLDVIMTKH